MSKLEHCDKKSGHMLGLAQVLKNNWQMDQVCFNNNLFH